MTDTSDKELELILWRLFENGTNEWEEVHDIGRSVAKAIKELEPYINHRLEEARIDELARLLNKKDDLIPDWLFKKIKDRIQQLRYYHKSSINNNVIIKEK